jgi:YVTN family beta-propeller protein
VRARIEVGDRPRNSAFTADGRHAFVPGEGDSSIAVIDVATDKMARRVTLSEGSRPMGIVLTPGGRNLLVTTGRGGELVRLNPDTLAVTGRVAVGARPWGLSLSPDGRFAFTANGPSNDVAMVDVATMKVIAHIPAGDRPWGVATVFSR